MTINLWMMDLQKLVVLGSYIFIAIELIFLPVPSEASTFSLIFKNNDLLQRQYLRKKHGRRIIFINIILLPSIFIVGFFFIPLIWIFYSGIYQFLLPFGKNIPLFLGYISIGFIICGTLFTLVAILELRSTLHKNQEKPQLKTNAVFSISRNPIIVGMHVLNLGYILVIPSWVMIIGFIVNIINMHYRIQIEEAYLELTFGDKYREYKKRVNRYF